jgi:uncharacterized protein YbjT (DUF2867 family)
MTRSALVVGATGDLGGAVVDHLRSGVHGDYALSATVGHPHSVGRDVARLRDRGVDVVEGDLDDPASYRGHLADIDVAVLLTTPANGGAAAEAERGREFVDAAVDADVEHLAFASAMGTDRVAASDVEALAGKQRIETYLTEAPLTYTVVRPGLLVQAFERQREGIADGVVAWPVESETLLAIVDADDVGRAVATAFEHPERDGGVHLDVAGDLLTFSEVAEGFAEVREHDVSAEHVTDDRERERFGDLTAELYAWHDANGGFAFHPTPLTERGIQPRSLHDALRRTGWAPVDDETEATARE